MTQWRTVQPWAPYEGGVVPEIRRDLAELEREIIAGLLDRGDPAGSPANAAEPPRAA
jgi:hypothetical protein